MTMLFSQLSRYSLTYTARLLLHLMPFVSIFSFASAFKRARDACRDAWQELSVKEREDYWWLWCAVREGREVDVGQAFEEERLVVLRYLHAEGRLAAENVGRRRVYGLCLKGNIIIVQWLHSVLPAAIDKQWALHGACGGGHIELARWLHSELGLTAVDARSVDNCALGYACSGGHLEVAQWLHATFGLGAADARADGNYALRWACRNGHLEVVKWLHTTFNLNAEDARDVDCYALEWSFCHGHLDVMRYLHSSFGLNQQDFECWRQPWLISYAWRDNHRDAVFWVCKTFNITPNDDELPADLNELLRQNEQ